MPFKSFRTESREDFGRTLPDGHELTDDELKLGALQRMADALETIAKDKQTLEDNYKYMTERRDYWQQEYEALLGKYRAQKGIVTKLKKKLQAQQQQP